RSFPTSGLHSLSPPELRNPTASLEICAKACPPPNQLLQFLPQRRDLSLCHARTAGRRGGAHLRHRLCARSAAPAFARSRPLPGRVRACAQRRRRAGGRERGTCTAVTAAKPTASGLLRSDGLRAGAWVAGANSLLSAISL